jgi:hypothetical protein
MIIIAIFITIKYQQNLNKEQWLDVNMNSFAPMFDTLKFSGLNVSKFANGFHLEDDNTKCVCQCNRKCKPPVSPSTASSSTVNVGIGTRINYYPWFVPNSE